MKASMKVIVFLACFEPLLAASAAMAGEAPDVAVVRSLPGWATIYYKRKSPDGDDAVGYSVERKDAGVVFRSVAPGQVTDANLKPDTEYAYRVCAEYEGEDEASCSPFVAAPAPAQSKPANFDPPYVNNVTIDIDKIAISWGPTGDYTTVLLRLDDDRGANLGQWEKKTPIRGYGSFTFQPLPPNTTFHIILKGCSWSPFKNCGPWSQRFTFTTHGPQPPPPPPGKPTLSVSGAAANTVSLAWTVKVVGSYPDDRVMLIRDGAPYKQLEARSWLGGVQGAYTDTVTKRHAFQVCFERATFGQRVCSDRVIDPLVRSLSEAEIGASVTKRIKKRSVAEEPGVSVARPPITSGNAAKMSSVSVALPAAYCAAYADEAVASANENISLNCGGAGGRWTTDRAAHVNWCMGLGGDRTVPQAETAARSAALSACRAAQ